jgi:ParB-like nuclease domain
MPDQAPGVLAAASRTEMPLSSISPGERAGRHPGDLSALMASIAADGLLSAVTVSPEGRLVLGARRLEACRRLGWGLVPAVQVTFIGEALERLEAENAEGSCLEPLTVTEAIGMDFALRELRWWPRRPAGPRGGGQPAPLSVRTKLIAGLLGMNVHQYWQARELAAAARGYREALGTRRPVTAGAREQAAAALATVACRSDLNSAHRRFRAAAQPWVRPDPTPRQVAMVTSAVISLAGIASGLSSDYAAQAPAVARAAWERDIQSTIRTLHAFLKTIRENDQS